ncbi:MAG: SMP-30/gluconolactonase/LRE family protein [Phycisphaerae bacterium]|nr:SMP-30/gluconolactonase/LRE family protein [Phycisphaerae bacterium]
MNAGIGWLLIAGLLAAGDFDVKSPEFKKVLGPEAKLVKLAGGMFFTEGPVWVAKGEYLLFSDIPMDEVKRWSKADGLSVWLKPSHNANGHTLDRQGRLMSCEHGARRVTRMTLDEKRTTEVLADKYQGKRFNAPNDVVVKSDGTIWFTDPGYGLDLKKAELPKRYVFCLNPDSGDLRPVVDDFNRPNGLCFSPDEKRLYVADSGNPKPRHVRVFDVTPDNKLTNSRVLAELPKGVPDGMRMDTDERLYVTGGEGVYVYDRTGKLLGTILMEEVPANCTFGGEGRHTLFITARKSLYAVKLAATGAQQP